MFNFKISLITSLCMPSLGGSVIIKSHIPCLETKFEEKMFFISPVSKKTLFMLLSIALFLADITASSTDSIPITFLELFAIN